MFYYYFCKCNISVLAQTTDLLEGCQKLLDRFKYPWEMMPLMYAILKDAKADLEEAARRIDEGYNICFSIIILLISH